MNFTQDVLQGPLLQLWDTMISYLPNLVGAIFVFLIGVMIALLLRSLVVRVIALLRIDDRAHRRH